MANSAIRPAFSNQPPSRGPLVPHHRWDPDRWTGVLHLRWRIPKEHPVVIGAGWQRVEETQSFAPKRKIAGKVVELDTSERRLVAEIVRRGPQQTPVLPGSSLKGALRQIYELLTASCIRGIHHKNLCNVKPKEVHGRVCPACSLFGAPGYGGRLAFIEAVPEGRPQVLERQVPIAWGCQKPVEGYIRVYDQSPDRDLEANLRPTDESVRAVYGDFRSYMCVTNATEEELGLLLTAAGVEAPSSPGLRLGGKKFHGLGAVDSELVRVVQSFPRRSQLENEEAAAWGRKLVETVLGDSERRRAYNALHAALATGS